MPEQHRHLANKYEDTVNLRGRHIVAAARLQLVYIDCICRRNCNMLYQKKRVISIPYGGTSHILRNRGLLQLSTFRPRSEHLTTPVYNII